MYLNTNNISGQRQTKLRRVLNYNKDDYKDLGFKYLDAVDAPESFTVTLMDFVFTLISGIKYVSNVLF